MARILLIEADSLQARSYLRVLETAGHEVRLCRSAQPAINAAEEFQPELIVLELQLAGNNGVEFLYEYRSYSEWTDIPVIIFSLVPRFSLGLPDAVWEALGVVRYLYKPETRLQSLVDTVNDLLPQQA